MHLQLSTFHNPQLLEGALGRSVEGQEVISLFTIPSAP